jgi:hypothetical protein
MIDQNRIIVQLLQLLAELGWTPPPTGDVIDQILAGGVLTTSQAADACDASDTTIHRWLQDAAEKGKPLGVLSPAGYIIGKDRLLAYIEREQGRHARLVAESRGRKYADVWSRPPQLLKRLKRVTG